MYLGIGANGIVEGKLQIPSSTGIRSSVVLNFPGRTLI